MKMRVYAQSKTLDTTRNKSLTDIESEVSYEMLLYNCFSVMIIIICHGKYLKCAINWQMQRRFECALRCRGRISNSDQIQRLGNYFTHVMRAHSFNSGVAISIIISLWQGKH